MPPDLKLRKDQKKSTKSETTRKKISTSSTVSPTKEVIRKDTYRSGSIDRREKPRLQGAVNAGRTGSVDRAPKPEKKASEEKDKKKLKPEEIKSRYARKTLNEDRKKYVSVTGDKPFVKKNEEKSSSLISIDSKKKKTKDSNFNTRSSDKVKPTVKAYEVDKSNKKAIPENKGKERSRTFTKPVQFRKDASLAIDSSSSNDTTPCIRPSTSTIRKGPPGFVQLEDKGKEILGSSTAEDDVKVQSEKEITFTQNSSLETSMLDVEYDYEDDFEDYESDFEVDSEIDSITGSITSDNVEVDEEIKENSDYTNNENSDEQEKAEESTFGLLLQPTIVKRSQSTSLSDKAHEQVMKYFLGNVDIKNSKAQVLNKYNPLSVSYNKFTWKNLHSKTIEVSSNHILKMSQSYSKIKQPPDTDVIQSSNKMKKSRSFFDFACAKEEQQKKRIINKVMKRGNELLEIITLDKVHFDVFDMPPMKYDTYIKSFGKSNTKQAYVQTENYEEEEVQTEEIDTRKKWTQHPPNDPVGVGGDLDSVPLHSNKDWKSHFKTNAVKLNNFVQNVSPVILALIAEDLPKLNIRQITHTREEAFFSQGYYKLKSLPALKGASVVHMCFSQILENYLISVHGDSSNAAPEINGKGVICVWNMYNTTKPEFVLVSNSQPVCACFGPVDSSTVIAGMVDGAIMLWDLTELASAHSNTAFQDMDIVFRSPTYNTAAVVGEGQHYSCVVSIQAIQGSYSTSDSCGSGTIESKDISRSFHVLSLEDMGIINIWIVVEVYKPDRCGSNTDLGLAPGGKLKLVQSSTIDVHLQNALSSELVSGIRTFEFRALPSDPNHLLLTTDAGIVIHTTRHNGTAVPKCYIHDSGLSVEIRSIDCSLHNDLLFLVGCNDGSVRLHNVKSARPLIVWPQAAGGHPVSLVKWSSRQPAIFYVLDSSSHIYMWDLRQQTSVPANVCHFSDTKITWFALNGRNLKKKNSDCPSQMAISKENGDIEIHALKQQIDVIPEVEYLRQLHFMQNL